MRLFFFMYCDDLEACCGADRSVGPTAMVGWHAELTIRLVRSVKHYESSTNIGGVQYIWFFYSLSRFNRRKYSSTKKSITSTSTMESHNSNPHIESHTTNASEKSISGHPKGTESVTKCE
jgi:hypothetical protein